MKPPVRILVLLPFACLLAACAFSSDGGVRLAAPQAIQGDNDVRGDPIQVPGAGMGVGAGSPSGVSSGGAR